jgi:hypothetical protein
VVVDADGTIEASFPEGAGETVGNFMASPQVADLAARLFCAGSVAAQAIN